MSKVRRFVLMLCTFLILFLFIPGIVILDLVPIPKPITEYSFRLLDTWNSHLSDIGEISPTEYTSRAGYTVLSDFPFTNRSSTRTKALSSAPTTGDNSTAVHREKTYGETFLDFPDRHFTDILAKPPVQFLPNFKNPCWIEKARNGGFSIKDGKFRGRLRCLPYFFLIGFPKCGTTDLFKRFIAHTEIQPGCAKEPHWWARTRFNSKALSAYLQCFDTAAENIAESDNHTVITSEARSKITMDCSASTAWDQTRWRWIPQNNLTSAEPTVTNIHSIHHLLPDAKFIVIMRNPIDRLFSDYLYFNYNLSTSNFHKEVVRAITLLEACFKERTHRSCVYDKKLYQQLVKVRLQIGLYSIYIEDWLKLYPRQQFLFLRTEDYGSNITQSLLEIFTFLDVGIPDESNMQNIEKKPNANTRSKSKANIGKMFPETRALLEKFYSPWNKRLSQMFGDKRYLWQ